MTTANTNEDKLILGGHEFTSRFILGSGKFSLELVKACIEKAGTQIVTLALRRANEGGLANILDYVPKDVTLLPNTSGARNAEEAVRIARLSRELGCGDFVKIEVIHDSKYLLPDNYETIKATEILAKEGFVVMPYMYPDLNAARDLVNAGAACVMPLGSPIGSNKGICTKEFIRSLSTRSTFRSSWTQESAARHRHVRLWKWVLQQLWQIQLLQLQETSVLWRKPLRKLLRQEEVHIFPVWEELWREVQVHPHH